MLNSKNKIIMMSDYIVKKLIAINLKQRNKHKNNSNYSDKVNKRPRVVNLDLEEVQEAEKDLDEDVDKEKDIDDYKKI
ncbi:hypothetical protein F8M41_012663 [Gigaspora margarita]|uniref:Uncharacterized protein n=1 Tax=Gigaspora margarita TaxID=4874 RepID=A0A8H3WYM9_GIGMA|nr:hypothetical protein F8M41_012663 [Gigaspora margarita]